jgi:hypothetical protein
MGLARHLAPIFENEIDDQSMVVMLVPRTVVQACHEIRDWHIYLMTCCQKHFSFAQAAVVYESDNGAPCGFLLPYSDSALAPISKELTGLTFTHSYRIRLWTENRMASRCGRPYPVQLDVRLSEMFHIQVFAHVYHCGKFSPCHGAQARWYSFVRWLITTILH